MDSWWRTTIGLVHVKTTGLCRLRCKTLKLPSIVLEAIRIHTTNAKHQPLAGASSSNKQIEGCIKPASVAQWANALAEPQCSEPGWLARWRGFDSHCCRHVESRFLHAIRLNSRGGTEDSPVFSYKCDGPSHPDWGRLGVVRAAGADNGWQGPAVL